MTPASLIIEEPLDSRHWTLEESFQYCDRMAASHYENFPVGSWFIPKRLRPYLHSIYAFARVADDFADEPQYHDGLRFALLENWEAQLLQCLWRKPQHPIFIALRETLERFDLPIGLFQALLTAFKMDVTTKRHEQYEDLLAYCSYSANPVGRLVLLLFGYRKEEDHQLSDYICSALQLANFWQDVEVDLQKDRIYLPLKEMAAFGCTEADLREHRLTPSFQNLMMHQTRRTRALFHQGRPLLDRVNRDLRFELHLTWNGGVTLLDRIEAAGCDVFTKRPSFSMMDKLLLVGKAAFSRSLPTGTM